MVEMELDLPRLGRWFVGGSGFFDGARIGVLEGRVPSRPACFVLMPMVEMELDLPGGAARWFVGGLVFLMWRGLGLWKA